MAQRYGDLQSEAGLATTALVKALLGPLDEARATLARAFDGAADVGDRLLAAKCRAVAGVIESCAGDHTAVLREVGTLPEDLEAHGASVDPVTASLGGCG